MSSIRRYIDIGANLTDEMYQGSYHGSKKHEPDLDKVLNRTWAGGMDKMIVTGGSLMDSKKAIDLSQTDSRLFSTVGCHPTRCSEFLSDPDNYLDGLRTLISENRDKVVAIGECGLDFERLHFCEKDVQIKYFEFQLQLSSEFQLPLFLHCRAAASDLVQILERNTQHIRGGVVHSFDGTRDELENILKLNLYIGINGCSLRTKENLEVAARIPQDRLMIETDSPWCEVKPTHAGYQHVITKHTSVKKEKHSRDSDQQVKGRNEPVNIVQVLEILAAIRNEDIDQLAEAVYNNTCKLFFNSFTSFLNTETEKCRVEVYKCDCGGNARFARYNEVRTLLRTRRGRCGEWANCFTLLCRALGYDTRYVYDTTDHVWCEVFDYDSLRWLHVDPCEATLDAPLTYEHGWSKSLCYILAFSRDDLQDVTWRYTSNHKAVMRRRNEVSESALVLAIMTLRNHRHTQVSPARRRYLDVRTLKELVDLLIERQPNDYETHGRISGSKAWRSDRGEIGKEKSHTFEFTKPGLHCVDYYTSSDKYRILYDGLEVNQIASWKAGVYNSDNIFRKVEIDWQQTYLARDEGEDVGTISWKLAVKGDNLSFDTITVNVTLAVYETGVIEWTIQFDDETPLPVRLKEGEAEWRRACRAATLRARLSGGAGEASWQHAQIARQPTADNHPALRLHATVTCE